jgi:subtilase family serine protease
VTLSTIQAGSTTTVSDTVVNQGAGLSASSTTRFYLSIDGALDPTDVLVPGSRSVPALGTDTTSPGSTAITIPGGMAAGSYYLLAKADADEAAAETLETNNVRLVRKIQITAQ